MGTYIGELQTTHHLEAILQKQMLQSHHRRTREETISSERIVPADAVSGTTPPNQILSHQIIILVPVKISTSVRYTSPLCIRYPPTPYSLFFSSSCPPSPSHVYLVNSTPSLKGPIRRLQQRWAHYHRRQSRSVLIPAHSGMAQTAGSLRR